MRRASGKTIASIDELMSVADEIGKTIVAAESKDADREGTWVRQSMDALRRSGLTALVVPEECGGYGQGPLFAGQNL